MKRRKRGKRALAGLLTAALCGSLLPSWGQTAEAAESSETGWAEVELEDITSSDEVAIAMTTSDGTTYVLPNAKASTGPTAVEAEISGDELTVSEGSDEDYMWTFEYSEDEGYTITSEDGTLYTTAANNGIRVGTNTTGAGDVWNLDDTECYLYATDSKDAVRYLGVYTTNPDWRAYTNTTGNIAGQSVSFWKMSTVSEDSEGESEEVDTPSATYSEADKTVTFSCTTDGVTYYYSTDGENYTELDGTELDVSSLTEETVLYYYASLNGADSETASLTIPASEAEVEGYALVTDSLSTGDQVMIYYPDSELVITDTASGSRLTGSDEVEVSDGVMAENSVGAVFTVSVDDDGYITFITDDGEYLTSGSTGNSLTLEDEASDYSLWTLEAADESGSYYIKNVNASYNGKDQYLEYYSGFTVYGFSSSKAAIYTFQFYLVGENAEVPDPDDSEDAEEEEDSDSGEGSYCPADGDSVAVYYPNGGLALTGTASGSKLTGVEASVSGDVLTSDDADSILMLTVSVDSDGYYTFTDEEGQYLTSGSTGNSLTLEDEASDYSLWTLEEADGGYFIQSVNASYNGNAQYMEYYSGFTTYGKSSSSSESLYIFQFYTEVAASYETDPDVVQDIAQWAGQWGTDIELDDEYSVNGDSYESNDMLDEDAVFTAVVGGENIAVYTSGTGTTYMGGSGLGSGSDDYLQFAVCTSGWGDMTLSFRLRASNSASGAFQLQYSTDGENFSDFTTGSYTCSYTSYSSSSTGEAVTLEGDIEDGIAEIVSATNYITYTFDVPAGAENAETLYIRLVPDTTVRANGNESTPSSSGTIRIDSVVLEGSPIVDDSITGYVSVDPDNSDDVAAGTELTLSSSTEGASIWYRFVDTETGEGEWLAYDESSKPVLPDELPATLETYAACDGLADSVVRILTYAAGTVSAVKMSPNGGGVYIEDESQEVTLSTATEGATIYYAVSTTTDDDGDYVFETDDSGEIAYTEYTEDTEILLEKGFGGLSIKAYAVKEGYEDSAVTTRTFTERSQETYNIYFGQLHSHTSYSDGAGTCEDAYQHATEVGEETGTLDFLAVTDHSNSFDNADDATITDGFTSEEWTEGQALADEYTTDSFVAIFGYEMTWSNGLGHINTYNTDGFQSRTQTDYSTYSTALQNYYETLKTVSDSISQFNHPGTTFGDFSDFSYYDEEIDELITLIEVGNGEGTVGSSGYFPSYEYYTRALDKGWHVSPTNNQDNHKGLWGDANTARSVVLADELTEDAIYDAMRNYRVYATEDNDLDIYYTLDSYIMGSILSSDDVGDTVTLTVDVEDLTDDSIGEVEVIVNGGYSLASQTVEGNSDTVTFEVTSDYSYYYIQVTEADGDIAVTSPVWVGDVEAVGISSFESDDVLAVQNQDLNMTVELYNNEDDDFEIESIEISVTDLDGNETDITDAVTATTDLPSEIESMGTSSYSFYYNYSGLGTTTYTVTVTGTLNGVTKVYSEPLELDYVSNDMVTKVIIDGTHYNDYVTGYYGDNMSDFISIAADLSIEVTIETEEITEEDLEDCALLIISAPAKTSGTANAGDYEASLFEDDFINMVGEYVQGGGTLIACGLADYQDNKASSAEYHTAAQINKLLEATGTTMSIRDDEAYDEENNGGQAYRLYPSTYNTEDEAAAVWLDGIVTEDSVEEGEEYQTYSQYSGCTVDIGDGTWLVSGFDTTYSIDSDGDNLGNITTDDDAYFLGYEEVGENGGAVFVAGGVFISDFEVDYELDNQYDLPYSNTTIAQNILSSVAVELDVTEIEDVRDAWDDGNGVGSVFKVRGYVTSGTSNEYNTLYDCIYIQDGTGGIDIYPYSESGLELGTYVEVTGYLAQYQGDIELKVMSYEILDDTQIVDPKLLSCKDAMDYDEHGGELIQVVGTVKEDSIEYNSDGTVAQFIVVDEDGGEAKIFIDGYILSGTEGENTLADYVEEGVTVSAVGVLYMHPEGDSDESVAVLRVRDCDEIITISAETDEEAGAVTVTTSTDLGLMSSVTVDGEEVSSDNYTADGNVLTFAESYIKTLSAGKHTAAVTFTVNSSSYTVEDTFDLDCGILGHDYDYENITWTWDDDYSAATATVVCKNDSSHTLEIEADVTSTEAEDGAVTYTAFADFGGETYTDTKTVESAAEDDGAAAPEEDEDSGVFEYLIIDGADQTIGRGVDLTVTANGEVEKFTGLLVDGGELDESAYTAESGSTIATISSDYLDTLALGTHSLTFVYEDGTAETTFTLAEAGSSEETTGETNEITEADDDDGTGIAGSGAASGSGSLSGSTDASDASGSGASQTGDSANMVLWILILVCAGGVIAAYVLRKKIIER